MTVGVEPQLPPAIGPEPSFAITSAAHLAFAAAPTMVFEGIASDPAGFPIQSIALTAQLMIEPARRGYDAATRERLTELFGPPASWTPTTQGMAWTRVSTVIASFTGSTPFRLEVPCTYDLEVASAKFFQALGDGEVPLSFHFNGTVFFRSDALGGNLQVVPVPWSSTAQFSMPIAAWRAMIAEHYPNGGWVRVSHETLAALNERRGARGLPSFDAAIKELLGDD
jgi:hypothetical protein